MLLNRQGLVWVGRRRPKWVGDRAGHIWQMPQGGIGKDETPRDAALRELAEETGVTDVEVIGEAQQWLSYELPPQLIGVALKGRYRGQRQRWFAMRFLGSDRDIDISGGGQHKAEFDDWKWVERERLPELAIPFKRAVYEAVIAEFGEIA
jgi:putative (di)nucleoside polyphosphate hydrolase